jgi:hypothetical protein
LTTEDIRARISDIEESYEFFLAYAAQGLTTDQASKSGQQLRGFLEQMDRALDGLAAGFRVLVTAGGLEPADRFDPMIDVLDQDIGKTRAALGLVRSRPGISSQLIDNLNASIHVRALLTDLFLLDEALPS